MGRDIRVTLGRAPVLVPQKPGPTNTGTTGALTEVQGNVTLSTPGMVYENKSVLNGRIDVTAANVTVRNCRVGGAAGGNVLISAQNGNCQNLLIDHCELTPDYPSIAWNAVHGHGYTIRYSNVWGSSDGLGMFAYVGDPDHNADCVAEYNWIHDLYCDFDPNRSDGITHNDCIQLHGGGNVVIRYNTLTANPSAASDPEVGGMAPVMVTPSIYPTYYGFANNVLIEGNWLDYGSAHLNLNPVSKDASGNPLTDTISSVTVRNNKFGRHGTRTGTRDEEDLPYQIIIKNTLNSPGLRTTDGWDTTNGNVFEDTGTPIWVERSA